MQEIIAVTRLSKAYHGKRVLEDLSFSVGSGKVLGLLGANGAGKSTSIECILGTRKLDGGTVRILGKDPRKERKQLFQRIENIGMAAAVMLVIAVLCTGISVKCFKWE